MSLHLPKISNRSLSLRIHSAAREVGGKTPGRLTGGTAATGGRVEQYRFCSSCKWASNELAPGYEGVRSETNKSSVHSRQF